jgi:hypothetical protein
LVGLAREVQRLVKGIPVIGSAIVLVLRSRESAEAQEVALRHIRELTVAFPEFQTLAAPLRADVLIEGADVRDDQIIEMKSFRPPRARTIRPEPSKR